VLGPYSSDDPSVLSAQMKEAAASGITDLVASWWGRGSLEDSRLPAVIVAARRRNLRVDVHIEPYPGRTVDSISDDIAYLRGLGIVDFYVYKPTLLSELDWAALNGRLTGVRVFAQTQLVGWAAGARFSGVYTYDIVGNAAAGFARLCAQAHERGLLCAPSVGPGYDAAPASDDLRYKSRRDGKTYDSMWRAAIRAGADLVTVTSFNEWHEGTQIEPAAPVPTGVAFGYQSYEGAYGLHGIAAETAYLERTLYWSDRFRAAR
jgi:glycoprotein endo-alpha-1,2-mannosidase